MDLVNGESATLGLAIMALANEGDGGSSTVPMTAVHPNKMLFDMTERLAKIAAMG